MSPPHQPPQLQELHFQYQRIAPIQPAGVGWYEALVRWHLADGTVRGPPEVLPFWLGAKQRAEFTRFTIERAAATLAAHPEARVSINLSPRQITHPVAAAGLEALCPEIRNRLIIELTEQRMRDLGVLWSSVAGLRERCDLVVLDDVTRHDVSARFGEDVPVDGVKLDRSVIAMMADPEERQRTIRFVQRATERFPIVVAEGIEDVSLHDLLHDLGVTHVQGFAIGRPRRMIGLPDRPEDERRGAPRVTSAGAPSLSGRQRP